MTREEQIVEAGKTAAEGKEFSVLVNKQNRTMSAYEIGFIEGAEWADSHPAWVSVEKELPPLHYEGANSTDFVLIYDGDDVLIAYYNFKEKKWYNEQYGALIIPATHWMLLPTPPAEKGGQDETD